MVCNDIGKQFIQYELNNHQDYNYIDVMADWLNIDRLGFQSGQTCPIGSFNSSYFHQNVMVSCNWLNIAQQDLIELE